MTYTLIAASNKTHEQVVVDEDASWELIKEELDWLNSHNPAPHIYFKVMISKGHLDLHHMGA